MSGRILAVDPGDKRIGVAISDPSQTIAKPLVVINHSSYLRDAKRIAEIARQYEVVKIILGQNLYSNGEPTYQGRKAKRLAEILKSQSGIMVELWDESGSTEQVLRTSIEMGITRRKRERKRDDLAAMMILQDYLNSCIA